MQTQVRILVLPIREQACRATIDHDNIDILVSEERGCAAHLIQPFEPSPPSMPWSMYNVGRGAELSARSTISTPSSRLSAGDATASCLTSGPLASSLTIAGTTMSSRKTGKATTPALRTLPNAVHKRVVPRV